MARMILASALAVCISLPGAAMGQAHADESAVRRAALDYLEGFYQGDSSLIARSVHPDVAKIGFAKRSESDPYSPLPMSYEEMFQYTRSVRENNRQRPDTDPKEVVILDLQDQTAAVKVIAWWGNDYLQLAKYDGRWMIIHVLWQSTGS